MSKVETSEKEPFPNCLKINHNNFWYIIPEHEVCDVLVAKRPESIKDGRT